MISIPNLQHNVPLRDLTTYKIGGPAEYFVEVKNQDELVSAVREARSSNTPYFILGCGANILIRDGGIKGLVIYNRADGFKFDGNRLIAQSGATIEKLIEACRDHELSGLEHFVGIPSTVGGAMRQNLHFLSPDRQSTLYIESVVHSAKVLTKDSEIKTVDKTFFQFGYDDSIIHHQDVIVLEVTFELSPSTRQAITHQMEENMAWRVAKQPQLWDFPSCGSVFKKIKDVGAGRLIDQAGLKGFTVGGAQVSQKHANYIVNLGNATAADVEAVIAHVQAEVKAKTGYELECEINRVGEL